jgi:DNA-binding XRE family transcriptional regulator
MYNRISKVNFYSNYIAICEFNDGSIKEYDFKKLFNKYPIFKRLKDEPNLFINGYVASGGCGIIFNDELDIASEEIYINGVLLEQRKVENINMQIANMISKARCERNITQKELAIITGIHQAEISKIERGIGNPSIKTLERIAKGLGLKLELFIR